jgi:nucleoside-diphosphate-sugar epimerase
MNILITGGAGFIGSNIAETLVRQGEVVRVLDNCSTGRLSNLDSCIRSIEFIHGDIRDLAQVREAMEGIDYVLHQAAVPSVGRSVDDPITTNESNVTGTLNVLVAARDAGVRRVVYAGSSSSYGNSEILPKREDMPARPISPYAISKYTGEQYCRVFYELYGLETVVLRYFNVFGPRQNPDSQYAAAVPTFINAITDNRQTTIFGDGEQSRDFTFVENVVQANILACHAEGAAGEVFNIACGKRTTINRLVEIIKGILGYDGECVYDQERRGDVRHSLADISKARRILGYEPLVDLETGLERTIGWFKASSIAAEPSGAAIRRG